MIIWRSSAAEICRTMVYLYNICLLAKAKHLMCFVQQMNSNAIESKT